MQLHMLHVQATQEDRNPTLQNVFIYPQKLFQSLICLVLEFWQNHFLEG